MAMTEGYTQYVCDRCGAVLYAQPTSPEAQRWSAVRRVSAAGSDVERLMCPSCATAYQPLVEQQERDFIAFMKSANQ